MAEPMHCEFCDHTFVPNPFNWHHQRCCGRARCLRAMDAQRQARFRDKHGADPHWRAAEVARVLRYRRRKRSREQDCPSTLALALLGMLFEVFGHPDEDELATRLRGCIECGQDLVHRLPSAGHFVRGP